MIDPARRYVNRGIQSVLCDGEAPNGLTPKPHQGLWLSARARQAEAVVAQF